MGSTRTKARRRRQHTRRPVDRPRHKPHRRRRSLRAPARRPRRRTIPSTPQPEPAPEPREVRVRLDDGDRQLILAGLEQLLPEQVRKDGWDAFHKLHYKHQVTLRPVRNLIRRLQAPRRGHPSTW